MNTVTRRFKRKILALSVALAAGPAFAVPALQLDILGGSYDGATQSVLASGNSFSLYALADASKVSLSDTFYLSVALLGIASPGGNYGSFAVNGATVNATGDMVYGTPPVDAMLGNAEWDPGDLSSHGIFPAYFKEVGFTFSASQQSGIYNSQDDAGSGPIAGTVLYYKRFDFEIAGLNPGQVVHFDLYNEKFSRGGEIDINKFAPFSHDAQAVTLVPEPETYAMLLAGLGLVGLMARRRRARLG